MKEKTPVAIKPILHRILVEQDSLESTDDTYRRAKAAGIEVVGTEAQREQAAIDTGKVVEVGPTAFRDFGVDASPIKEGDLVVFAKYGGKAIIDPATKKKYIALNDEDIIAVLS
jgi:co-chaperonin GroES (HSP10)